jgi:hypothetical protein
MVIFIICVVARPPVCMVSPALLRFEVTDVCGETLPTDDEQTGDPLGTLQESPGTEREDRLLTRGTSLIRRW